MDTIAAVSLARELMKKWGCDDVPLKLNYGKNQLGAVIFYRNPFRIKEMQLSRYLIEGNNEDQVKDTILHEIAHILANREAGGNQGHNWRWRQWCIKVGAKPERCANPAKLNMPKHNYLLHCEKCHDVIGKKYRKRDQSRYRSACCRATLYFTTVTEAVPA